MTPQQLIKQGNTLMFEQVFEENHRKLYYFILNKTHSEYLAEEVVQETFIKLWRYKESLNEEIGLSIQIFRIAKTVLIDIYRKENTREKIYSIAGDKEASILYPESNINELSILLARAIEGLPPIRRTVFQMSRFEGFSYAEIARALSISSKTVENHISLALKQLRSQLGDYLVIIYFFVLIGGKVPY